MSVIGFLAGGLCLAMTLMEFGCFRSCVSSSPPREKPRQVILQNQTPVFPGPRPGRQTPVTPLPSPLEQTPVTPLAKPAAPPLEETEAEAAEGIAEPKPELSLAAINQVEEGMDFSQVMALLGNAGMAVSSRGADSMIYKWTQDGTSLVAKFEQGKLVRKTVLGAKKEPSEKEGVIKEEEYNQVKEGMTLEEVMALFDVKVKAMSGTGEPITIYKWSDENGSSFTAKFENGKLVRKTGLYIAPMEPEKTDGGEMEDRTQESTGEESLSEEKNAVAEPAPDEAAGAETGAAEETVVQNTEEYWQEEEPKPVVKPRTTERIKVAGQERRTRQREEKEPTPVDGKSYKPKAKLPKYTHTLRRGTYNISLRNEGDSAVKIGLRSGKRGWNGTLAPGDRSTVKVEEGSYELYYIYSNAPYTLQQGRTVIIDGNFMADVAITLIESSSEK